MAHWDDFIKEEEAIIAKFYKNWRNYISEFPHLTAICNAYEIMDAYMFMGKCNADAPEFFLNFVACAERTMMAGKIPFISDDKVLEKLEAYFAYTEPHRINLYATGADVRSFSGGLGV